MVRKTAVILSVVLLVDSLLFAEGPTIPPGRWNKVEAETPGTGLVVILQGGEKIHCFLKSLSDDSITVITMETKERQIPKIAVQEILTAEKRSGPLWNGAVVGAAIPMAIVGIPWAAARDKSGMAEALLIVGGIGALIGVGIDAAVRGQITLYKAPKNKALQASLQSLQ